MKKLFIIPIFMLLTQACEKSLEFSLEGDAIGVEDALDTPEEMQALLNSCYDVFANVMDGGVQNLHELLGETLNPPPNSAGSLYYTVYSRGTFSFRTADGVLLDLYRCIYRTNIFMENLERFPEELDINKLRAEALFLRGWCHWELVKLWAQPYGYTPDNSHLGVAVRLESAYHVELRSTVKQVYDQVLEDLHNAEAALPESNGNYANLDAVNGLLAKVYFLMNDFVNAEKYASLVINSNRYDLSSDIERFIGDQSSETIFSTISIGAIDNRGDEFIGWYRSDKTDNPGMRPSKLMYQLFDTADSRSIWIERMDPDLATEYYKCHKFDKDFFGVPLIHLADLLLIRAESLLEIGGDRQQAADDLNRIRERAYGDQDHNVTSGSITIAEVQTERRKELAFEGDDCLQLRRRAVNGESITIRGMAWDCPGMALQFPASEKTEGFIFNEEGPCN